MGSLVVQLRCLCLVKVIPVGIFEGRVAALFIILAELLQHILSLDILGPFAWWCLGSCQIYRERFLIQFIILNMLLLEIVTILVMLEGLHVLQEKVAA